MALYDPQRHEPLAGEAWSEAAARAAIARIAADAWAAYDPERLWRIHPLDVSPERPDALKSLYSGAAGVIWALDRLARAGLAAAGPDTLAVVRDLPRRHRADLAGSPVMGAYMGEASRSYLAGEAGMRMLAQSLSPSDETADLIADDLSQGVGDIRGLIWGAAGAMTGALLMHERTGEARWRALFERHVRGLWDHWTWSEDVGAHVWTGELYGVTETRLGGLHGFAANAYPMLRGRDLLAPDLASEALDRIWRTFERTALEEDGLVNWPHDVGASTRPQRMPRLVQVCAGAPGAMLCLSAFPKDERWPVDGLLRQAGELVWRAGPVGKLPGLCHGVPGAGYALLKLFERTGDALWLERARAFAMHAIGQAERAVEEHGQRKISLWTGDLGLAVFLHACLAGDAGFPTLDVF